MTSANETTQILRQQIDKLNEKTIKELKTKIKQLQNNNWHLKKTNKKLMADNARLQKIIDVLGAELVTEAMKTNEVLKAESKRMANEHGLKAKIL